MYSVVDPIFNYFYGIMKQARNGIYISFCQFYYRFQASYHFHVSNYGSHTPCTYMSLIANFSIRCVFYCEQEMVWGMAGGLNLFFLFFFLVVYLFYPFSEVGKELFITKPEART